jgi:microcystin-dependent protein
MADTYTSSLGVILMGIGGDNNTWGTNLNNSVFQIFEDAIANALTAPASGGQLGPSNTLDLSANPPPAGPSAARYAALVFSGAITANQTVKVPNLTKWWRVKNATSGAFSVSLQTPSGTPVALPQNGGWQTVYCDGANNILVWPFNTLAVAMPNGSVAAPPYAFAGETNSGWYRAGTQDIRLAIAGADVLQVTGPSASTPSVVNIVSPNSLQLAGSSIGAFTTGDVKLTFKTAADPGWVLMNDGTIGDATSNATYGNANASALFQLLYNNISDADAPILTSGGSATTRGAQGSAATAFANHCRLTLPLVLGRALAAAGSGAGLTSRTLGHALGEETHQLSLNEAPTGQFTFNTGAAHAHTIFGGAANTLFGNDGAEVSWGTTVGGAATALAANPGSHKKDLTGFSTGTATSGDSITDHAGGQPHNNMQPTTFLNVMIKL